MIDRYHDVRALECRRSMELKAIRCRQKKKKKKNIRLTTKCKERRWDEAATLRMTGSIMKGGAVIQTRTIEGGQGDKRSLFALCMYFWWYVKLAPEDQHKSTRDLNTPLTHTVSLQTKGICVYLARQQTSNDNCSHRSRYTNFESAATFF